jgi:hypothetical protein
LSWSVFELATAVPARYRIGRRGDGEERGWGYPLATGILVGYPPALISKHSKHFLKRAMGSKSLWGLIRYPKSIMRCTPHSGHGRISNGSLLPHRPQPGIGITNESSHCILFLMVFHAVSSIICPRDRHRYISSFVCRKGPTAPVHFADPDGMPFLFPACLAALTGFLQRRIMIGNRQTVKKRKNRERYCLRRDVYETVWELYHV